MKIDTNNNNTDNTDNQLHMGRQVREVFNKSGLSIQQFADMIPCNVNNIYKIYDREVIDFGLLKRISKIFKYDFFKLYSQELQLEPVDCMQIICHITMRIFYP